MPVIKSAQKREKQAAKRTAHNKEIKDVLKKSIKDVKKSVGILDAKKISEKLSKAFSEIDKAAKRNVIHKNTAARRKSRLAKLIAKGEKLSTDKKRTTKKKTVSKPKTQKKTKK